MLTPQQRQDYAEPMYLVIREYLDATRRGNVKAMNAAHDRMSGLVSIIQASNADNEQACHLGGDGT